MSTSAPTALYTFKLLEAMRSDDPSQVQPFLDELRTDASNQENEGDNVKAGKLLGMAVRVASGEKYPSTR